MRHQKTFYVPETSHFQRYKDVQRWGHNFDSPYFQSHSLRNNTSEIEVEVYYVHKAKEEKKHMLPKAQK